MARTFGPALNTIGDNPYASARHKKPDFHTCKACDRTISSKDWAAHNSSKKHFACEDEMRRAAKKPVDTKSPAMDKEANIVSFAQGAWKQDDGAPYLRGDETDVCYGCGESGHFKRECPNRTAGSGRDACYGCGKQGHQKRDCPDRGGNLCFTCGMPGHRKADCPAAPQARQGGGAGQQCFNCEEYGHLRFQCPNKRVIKCRNCDEIGHKANECSKPKDWSRVQCNNCNSYGHTVKRCRAPPSENTNGGSWGDSGADPGAAPTGDWVDGSASAGGANWGDAIVVDGW
ncbi:hypothetical protein PMIN03_002143 [Paraphaeosphaeria minitans]